MTTEPHGPNKTADAADGSAGDHGLVEVLDRDPSSAAEGSLLPAAVLQIWRGRGARSRALRTGAGVVAGVLALVVYSPYEQPPGTSTTYAASGAAGVSGGSATPFAAADPRDRAVSVWLKGQRAWQGGDIDALCRSFMGIGVPATTPGSRSSCGRVFSRRTGALRGLRHAGPPGSEVDYRASDAFVIDGSTVLIYGRRERTMTGTEPDSASSIVYVMRLVPGVDWRWVGTTDGRSSIGWVPPGFPPVRS